MSHDRHARAGELFLEALELQGDERGRFLDRECCDDAVLRAQVEELLIHDESNVAERIESALETTAAEAVAPPTVIGGFRVVGRLGSGGMGVVYEAEQTNPSRRVALKLVRTGLASESNLRRFQHEAEVLGWLDHPGIAHVYQAGTEATPAGAQPWFAMELVRGEPLTEYARRKGLDTRARVALLDLVCDAVGHAHAKGVVHRDLKPGNILVDEAGRPKVLDFGVARVLDGELVRETLVTGTGELVGTLPYMSPEQIAGDPARVDARTDVYALGVIAYELFAGRRPHDLGELSLPAAAAVIQDHDPEPLARVAPGLDRDLVTIVHKALEKDPARRYASVGALRADLSYYRRELPILARPVSTTYRVAKFARRNRLAIAAAVVVIVGLVAGLATALVGLDRAVAERKEKEDALVESESASEFLADVLSAAQPGQQGRDVLLRDVLARAAPEIDVKFADRPRVAARLHMTLARTYYVLGLPEGLEHARAAHSLYAGLGDGRTPEAARAARVLAELLTGQDELDEARAVVEGALPLAREVLGANDRDTLDLQRNLGILLQREGEAEAAREVLGETYQQETEALGADDIATLASHSQMAKTLAQEGRLAEAAELFEENLRRTEALLGPEHPETLTALYNLATAFALLGQPRKALEIDERLLGLRSRVLGEAHPSTVRSQMAVASGYSILGRHEEAQELLTDALAKHRTALGAEHPDTLETWLALATSHAAREDFEGAAEIAEEIVAAWERSEGPEHLRTLDATRSYGSFLSRAGRHDEALEVLGSAVERYEGLVDPSHREAVRASFTLGLALVRAGEPEQALDVFELALDGALGDPASNDPELRDLRASIAELLLEEASDLHDPERALELAELATKDAPEPRCDHLLVLARAHMARGEYGKALGVIERIEPLAPGNGIGVEELKAAREACERERGTPTK